MKRSKSVTLLVSCAALAICPSQAQAKKPPASPADSAVELSSIVNALKCELAETFSKGDYVKTLVGKKVDAKLKLSNVVTRKLEGEAGAEFKVFGIGVEAAGSGSRANAETNEIEIAFSYDNLRDGLPVPAFCQQVGRNTVVKNHPFGPILDGIRTEYAKISAGEPMVQFGSVDYTIGFDVTREISGGAKLNVLVFTIGGTGTRTLEASQQLTLSFNLTTLPRRVPIG